jgi:hypothetical protein
MMRRPGAAVLLGLAVAACGSRNDPAPVNAMQTARACTPPRSYWLQPVQLDGGLSAPTARLSLDQHGVIHWEGHVTTFARLSQNLGIVATMNPRPNVFLETEAGVPCALLEQVRDEMDRRLQCRAEGSCAEGIWIVWEVTPPPPGTPVS